MSAQSVLLPYQQAWMADRAQVRVCEKSRRVGLSWSEAAHSALEAAKASGQDTWYLGYSQDMAQEFIRDCAWWAGHFQFAAEAMEQTVINDEDRDILAGVSGLPAAIALPRSPAARAICAANRGAW